MRTLQTPTYNDDNRPETSVSFSTSIPCKSIIDLIGEGAELTAETRNELACLDGLIRATIQVDPAHDGGIARAAHQRYRNLQLIFISDRIYAGYATPTEAASLGVVASLLLAWQKGAVNGAMLRAVGFGDSDFEKPIVGVANGHSNMNPCNAGIQPQ